MYVNLFNDLRNLVTRTHGCIKSTFVVIAHILIIEPTIIVLEDTNTENELNMFVHFFCLSPLQLAIMLDFNISKVVLVTIWHHIKT